MHRNPNHFPKYIKEEGCDKMEEKENAVFYPFLCMTYSNNCALPEDTKTNNNTKPDPESIYFTSNPIFDWLRNKILI